MNELPDSLLVADEPAPVTVHNENGLSPFLIVADHAGNSIPRALGRLGVPESERERHIAWDIGIAAVSCIVADALDAPLIQQNYSRLVIDCNRTPGSETSIPELRVCPRTSSAIAKFSEHEADGCEAQECERLAIEVLPIFGKPSAAVEPSNGALDDPTTW
jgi:N-formylglutamate amidohydrolase